LVKNESTVKTVSYTYNGISDTLAPSESKTYEVEAYTLPPANIADQNGIASIIMKRNGDLFTFIDAKNNDPSLELNLKVVNTLPISITIKANNYIDDNNSMEMSISANSEKSSLIYTRNPNFSTINTNYPVIFEWSIAELDELDTSGNPKKEILLIIR
jgi:hypothetical protein